MSSQVSKQIELVVAANVRSARDEAGLTQSQLAATLGVESVTVSRWERAQNTPSGDRLVALANALGVTPAWLYTDHTAAQEPAA
jgi:HTH-type transcriptional regulator, cell division transcriptional repressor